MRRLIIRADVNGTRLDPPRVVQRSPSVVAIAAMPGGASRPGRAPSTCREGREAPESLLAIRGPQCALEPPSEPHMCAECEDSAEGEIVLDTARGCAYYSILRQARKRLSEPRGRPRGREP